MFKIHQENMCFGCWVNLCCICRILEVPARRILAQIMLKALKGSGKPQGKCAGGLELAESLIVERGTLASLSRDLRLFWKHSPNSVVS
jgi:hypothetical protein